MAANPAQVLVDVNLHTLERSTCPLQWLLKCPVSLREDKFDGGDWSTFKIVSPELGDLFRFGHDLSMYRAESAGKDIFSLGWCTACTAKSRARRSFPAE